ncbi:MAG: NADH-quinone oxidoreductase subunit J [Thermodesulfobacteriota bacterium]
MQLLMFTLLGFGAVVSALVMVTNRKPVSAAMSLIVTMFCLAGLYVLLDAHLMAALQIIVYAGAIMVLFLFVIMLLNIQEKEGSIPAHTILLQAVAIVVVGAIFLGVMNLVKVDAPTAALGEFGTTKGVGKMLFTTYLLPFEIASVLLLAAIVGAVILAKRRIDDPGRRTNRPDHGGGL